MIATTIVMEGILQPDGRLVLDEVPSLPPGRVQVSMRPLREGVPSEERVPDLAWLDSAISAPFDLPREGTTVLVEPHLFPERLPEIWAEAE